MLDSTTLTLLLVVFPCPIRCGFHTHVTDRNLEGKQDTERSYDLTPNATFSRKTHQNVPGPPNTTSPGAFLWPLGIYLPCVFNQHTFTKRLQLQSNVA